MIKLETLAGVDPTNNHFLLGYIFAYVNAYEDKSMSKRLMRSLEVSANASNDGLLFGRNVLELVIVGIQNAIQHKSKGQQAKKPGIQIKDVIDFIDGHIQNLAVDRDYLTRTYFKEVKEEKIMKMEGPQSEIGLECPICCQQITISTVCPIKCGHLLHINCFTEHCRSQVSIKKLPILCPLEDCNVEIPTHDIEEYITGDLLQKYYEFSLHEFVDKNNKNAGWCPTAGCKAVFSFEGIVNRYDCPSCNKKYCLMCRTDDHEGLTCEQNREIKNIGPEQKEFLDFAQNAKYKRCPSCNFWVSKNHGCDHMTCRCSYEFCYRCGAESGTCDCDENESFYDDSEEDEAEEQEPEEQE